MLEDKMRKFILVLLVLSLTLVSVNAQEQTLGPDLVIDSVGIEPFPVEPGDTFEINFVVRNSNIKKTINGLEFSLQEFFPFSIEGDKIVRINSLSPNEQISFNFLVKTSSNAISGVNEIKLDFQEGGGIKYVSSSINIDVSGTARDPSIVSIRTDPEIIKPGDEVKMILTLKNTVPVLMKNIDINFDLSADDSPFTPIRTTTKRSLTSLNKGSSKDLIFNLAVDADADPKVYKIPLEIDYEDEFGNVYSIDTLTGLKISTEPELQYSIEKSDVYKAGNAGEIGIKIVNVGLADIKLLSVELEESNNYDIISVPEVYIGNLESDDYETAEFRIYVNSRSKELPLILNVRYKDSFNEVYEQNEVILLSLYSSSELSKFGIVKGGRGGNPIVYIILVIFAYLFIVEWRKTKNIPLALKLTVKRFLVFIKKVIKMIRPKTITKIVNEIVKFFKEP